MHGVIFSQINAVEWSTKEKDVHNKMRSFNRQEFVQALIRIAIAKYVASGKISDISDAVEQLLRVDLAGRLPAEALQNSNTFRLRCCYTEKTDQVTRAVRIMIESMVDGAEKTRTRVTSTTHSTTSHHRIISISRTPPQSTIGRC